MSDPTMDATSTKTIKELQSITSVADTDYLVVNQPDVQNVLTSQLGVTGKATVGQIGEQVKISQDLVTQPVLNAAVADLEESDTLLADAINRQLKMMSVPMPFLTAHSKTQLLIREGTVLRAPDESFFIAQQNDILDVNAILDIGAITNGKDYYLYFYRTQGGQDVFIISASKTAPDGLSQSNVVQIGGHHTLCVDAGVGMTYTEGSVVKNHPLNGFTADSILPHSVWCLNHIPYSEPEGMAYISALDFWCDIYLQSDNGFNTKSAFQGAITRSRQYGDHVEDMLCVRKELLSDADFAAAMLGSNEKTVVLGASESAATAGGAGGRKDTAQRRMVSIYGIEEGCGSVWQWLSDGTNHGQGGGWTGQSGGKGDHYQTGALKAGGSWGDSAYCGSRCRYAYIPRSDTYAHNGGRGRSRPRR